VYGIGGINFSFIEIEGKGAFSSSADDTEVGLNLGNGAEFDVSFGKVYGELKYIISDFDQLVLDAGVRIPINIK